MGSACSTASPVPLRGAPDEEGVDRTEVTRNAKGSEEPSSADPELWNIDGTEVDYLASYKVGGQMWYLQSRAKESIAAGKTIPGYPINKKACASRRPFSTD